MLLVAKKLKILLLNIILIGCQSGNDLQTYRGGVMVMVQLWSKINYLLSEVGRMMDPMTSKLFVNHFESGIFANSIMICGL